jgi:hypothetical protein
MTPQQVEEAQRVFEVTRKSASDELWRMCCLMASKQDSEMLGKTEFELRDMAHRIGAKTLEAAVNERRKKGGTEEAASPAGVSRKMEPLASTMPGLSSGGPRRS